MRLQVTRRHFIASSAGASLLAAFGDLPPEAREAPGKALDPGKLAASFDGRIIVPGDEEYERARRAASFNPRFDRQPLAIARCGSESDIARAIAFAREGNLDIAVRGGGHDVLAASTCEGGLLIDLGGLAAIRPDSTGTSVRVGAGARAGQVNAALGKSGQAVALGCNPRVGVSGLTLGGGLGWFIGRHGATCDVLRSARVVTADGRILQASAEENPDLYWAIRGGGGNFGIVSEWIYETFPLAKVVAGNLVYSGSLLEDFLAFYRDQMAVAPDELTVEVIGLGHLEPVVAALICYSGDPANADKVLAPWRSFGPPLADGLAKRPYYLANERLPERAARYFQWPGEPDRTAPRRPGSYWQGITVDALSDEAIKGIGAAVKEAPYGWSWGLGHVMRGAVLRVPDEATPLIRKSGSTSVHFDGGWEIESRSGPLMAWIDNAIRALLPYAGDGDYINYLSSDDPERVRHSYGFHYARLAELKQRYDPENLFHRNRNIRPAI